MIFVISPAKALDYETSSPVAEHSQPEFLDQAASLIETLRQLSPAEVAELMKLSDKLAALNVARYESWSRPFTADNAKPAVFAFNGDVYEGLNADVLDERALSWLQQHLRILSGLYGLLRPLDLMQPYRLEMGSKLETSAGHNLYQFWGNTLTDKLNELLEGERKAGREAALVNLASNEYFKAVNARKLDAPVVTPVFEDWKGGRYKVVSFYAKKARGMMVRFAAEQGVEAVEGLKAFDYGGYAYEPAVSDDKKLVFRRRQD
jgi:uncharacterized protein